jgi:hypothetical protein
MQDFDLFRNVGTVPKSNRKLIERGTIDTIKLQIHDRSHSRAGTLRVKLVLWEKTSHSSDTTFQLQNLASYYLETIVNCLRKVS